MAPGLVAAALSLANFVSAYFILPESLGLEHRTRRPLLDFGHLGEVLSRPRLRPLMALWGLAPFAFAGYTVALPLYAGRAFQWTETQLSIFFIEVGLTSAIVQGLLFGKLAPRFGERALLIAGLIGMALGIRRRAVLAQRARPVCLDLCAGVFEQPVRAGRHRPGIGLRGAGGAGHRLGSGPGVRGPGSLDGAAGLGRRRTTAGAAPRRS